MKIPLGSIIPLRVLLVALLAAAAGCGDATGGGGKKPEAPKVEKPDTEERDNTAPQVVVQVSQPDTTTPGGYINLTGTATDDRGVVVVRVVLARDSTVLGEVRDSAGPRSLSFDFRMQQASLGGQGRHLLRVQTRDSTGNTGTAEATVAVDWTPPLLLVMGPTFGPGGSGSLFARIRDFMGDTEPGEIARAAVQVNGGPETTVATYAGEPTLDADVPVTLPAEGGVLRLLVYDRAGNRARVEHRYEGGPALATLAAGGLHACGLTADGVAWCWGENQQGQLGVGTLGGYEERVKPTPVVGGHRFRAIAASRWRTCAVALDGDLWCWGMVTPDRFGQPPSRETAPRRVASSTDFRALAAGFDFTCALAGDGSAWCWGEVQAGQLGRGVLEDRSEVPVPVGGGHRFRTLSAGNSHVCGVTLDGEGWCWGMGGALGDGTTRESRSLPVRVAGGLKWKEIAAGWAHSCGIALDGKVYCWGLSVNWRLGTFESGPETMRALPTSPVPWPGTFESLSADDHTCGLTTAGPMVCWGSDDPRRRGIPSDHFYSAAPPAVGMGGIPFSSVVAGGTFTCALTSAGVTYCFGGVEKSTN